MPRWAEDAIKSYNSSRECECGNGCYTIVGTKDDGSGEYMVEWAHPVGECPFDCEDCTDIEGPDEMAYGIR